MKIQKLLTGVTVQHHVDTLNHNFNEVVAETTDIRNAHNELVQNISQQINALREEINEGDEKLSQQLDNLSTQTESVTQQLSEDIQQLENTTVRNSGKQSIIGEVVVEKNADNSGNLTVQGDLTVHGNTITEEHETLLVKDNIIVANSEGQDITGLSGLAIRKNSTATYGIMYDPTDDSVKLGLGELTLDDEFVYDSEEGLPIVIRDLQETADGHIVKWDSNKRAIVDGQDIIDNLRKDFNESIENNTNAHIEVGMNNQSEPSDTLLDGGVFLQLVEE